MEQEADLIVHEGVVVAGSALLRREAKNRYGSVPGLADEELADPDELERQVYRQMFRPVLELPVEGHHGSIRPTVDQDGRLDFGAFATVDFERERPAYFNNTGFDPYVKLVTR